MSYSIPVTFCIRSSLDNNTNAVNNVLIQPLFTNDNSDNTRKRKYFGYLSRKIRDFFPENNLKRKLYKNVSKSLQQPSSPGSTQIKRPPEGAAAPFTCDTATGALPHQSPQSSQRVVVMKSRGIQPLSDERGFVRD